MYTTTTTTNNNNTYTRTIIIIYNKINDNNNGLRRSPARGAAPRGPGGAPGRRRSRPIM